MCRIPADTRTISLCSVKSHLSFALLPQDILQRILPLKGRFLRRDPPLLLAQECLACASFSPPEVCR
jgi:hypothetical protein